MASKHGETTQFKKLNKSDIQRLLRNYEIGELSSCKPILYGFVNENWILQTSYGKYFLKRRHPKLQKPYLVSAQHSLMSFLRDNGFPAPEIIRSRSKLTFHKEKSELFEIQEYLTGSHCEINNNLHFSIAAQALGWYHELVENFDHPVFHRIKLRYGNQVLKKSIDRLIENCCGRGSSRLNRLMDELAAQTREILVGFEILSNGVKLVAHGDFYAGNILFQGNILTGVVDYDRAIWCLRSLEVAEALIYFATEKSGGMRHILYPGVLSLEKVYHFMAAYSQVTQLTDQEIQILPYLIRTIWLCASIKPPLAPRLSLQDAPNALPELLSLSYWASENAGRLLEIIFDARSAG